MRWWIGRTMRIRWGGHAGRSSSGLVLLELFFAIGVIIVAALWLLTAYHASLHLTEIAHQESLAFDDLKDIMEQIKATPFNQLTTSFPNGVVNGVVGGVDKYGALIGGYGLANEQITVLHQPNTAADPRELVVQLSWTNQGRTYQKSVSTIRSSKAS